ncbi:MAG: TonB-dependent receptor [Bacteroidota bacterium]
MYKYLVCIVYLTYFTMHAHAQVDSLVFEYRNRFPFNPKFDKASHTRSNQIQVINSRQIRESGYTTLGEVLQLADNMYFRYYANFTYQVTQLSSTAFENQNWILMINGQRIEHPRMLSVNLHELGISVYDIERIELVNTPGIYLNEYNVRGLIHIITRQVQSRLDVMAGYNQTHQVGGNLPNDDNRIGRNAALSIGSAIGKWKIQTQYNLHHSDGAYAGGISIYPFPSPAGTTNTQHSARAEVSYANHGTMHLFTTLYSTSNKSDWLAAGIPYDDNTTRHTHTQAYTYKKVTDKTEYKLRLSNSFAYHPWANLVNSINQVNATASFTHKTPIASTRSNFSKEVGLAQQFIHVNGSGQYLFRPYVSITYPLAKRTFAYTDAALSMTQGNYLPKFTLGMYKNNFDIYNWNLSATYIQRNSFEDRTLYYYMPYLPVNASMQEYISKNFVADAFLNVNLGRDMKFTWQSTWVTTTNEPYYFSYPLLVGQPGPWLRMTALTATHSYINNRLNLHYDIIKKLTVDIQLQQQNAYRNNSDWTAPTHRFSTVIVYELPAKFMVWSRFYYQRGTNAPIQLHHTNGQTQLLPMEPVFPTSVYPVNQNFRTVDLSVSKQFGKYKHQFTLALRDIVSFASNTFYNNPWLSAGLMFNFNARP